MKGSSSARHIKKYGFQQKIPTDVGLCGSEPVEEIEYGTETEGEKQLKLLLKKQLNTRITLKEHLAQERDFVNCSTYTPLTELIQGPCSLERYKEIEGWEEKHQELQRSGLTKEEISFYLAHEGKTLSVRKRAFPIEPSVKNEKYLKVKEKITAHQEQLHTPDVCIGVKTLSRHAMDIERTLYAGCNQKKQLDHLITENSRNDLPEHDPFRYVRDLSEKLVQNVHRQRKQKKCEQRIRANISNATSAEDSDNFVYNPNIHHAIVPLEEEEIMANRLSVEEIKKTPRFEKYSPGVPNKVLYLKNLHPKVNIRELQCLFDRFQVENADCIEYRILSGKMKGQAFITFPDKKSAQNALQLVNGYMLRKRPIIVEYGKKS